MDPMGTAFWLLCILHEVYNTITFNHCIKNCIPGPYGKHPRLSCSCLCCGEILRKSHTTCLHIYIYVISHCLNRLKETNHGIHNKQIMTYMMHVHSLHRFYTYKWHIAFQDIYFFYHHFLVQMSIFHCLHERPDYLIFRSKHSLRLVICTLLNPPGGSFLS